GKVVCSSKRERCVVPVYAKYDQTTKRCSAYVDFATIVVPAPTEGTAKKNRIKVVWTIARQDVDDKIQYRFQPLDQGIHLLGGSTPNPQDPTSPLAVDNDPTMDFANPSEENMDMRDFRWVSVGKRPSVFHYEPIVQYYDEAQREWFDCFGGDPTV